ncbi:hypothetical protein CRUP_024775, partial [Coryphaenoides rupestris]
VLSWLLRQPHGGGQQLQALRLQRELRPQPDLQRVPQHDGSLPRLLGPHGRGHLPAMCTWSLRRCHQHQGLQSGNCDVHTGECLSEAATVNLCNIKPLRRLEEQILRDVGADWSSGRSRGHCGVRHGRTHRHGGGAQVAGRASRGGHIKELPSGRTAQLQPHLSHRIHRRSTERWFGPVEFCVSGLPSDGSDQL